MLLPYLIRSLRFLVLAGIFSAVLLTACARQPAAQEAGQTPTVAAASPEAAGQATIPATAVEPSTPTINPNLHATDPQTVSLAPGQVQLVEFFAFW